MTEKVSITFTIEDMPRFKASYKKALETSGLSAADCAARLRAFDHDEALAEIMGDSSFHWEEHGLGY